MGAPEIVQTLPCGCMSWIEGDELHLASCSPEHDEALIAAAAIRGAQLGIPTEIREDLSGE